MFKKFFSTKKTRFTTDKKAKPQAKQAKTAKKQSEDTEVNFFRSLYRQASGNALDVAVKPQLVGELPNISNSETVLNFYVLQEYSRSNSILIDSQTKERQLPPALLPVTNLKFQIDENAGIIFLHHSKNRDKKQISPRLQRLITAVQSYPQLTVNLIPVTILWGRAPEKEDSLFKLLVADNWQEPSISKQLFNIGVMGRNTFVEFHRPYDLRELIEELTISSDDNIQAETVTSRELITNQEAMANIALNIQSSLNAILNKRRTSIIGPDLSDRRNVVDKLLYTPAIRTAIAEESKRSGQDIDKVRNKARHYLKEITSDYSYYVVRFFENFLAWLWTQLYDGVEVKNFDRVREVATDHEVIYVPCHRSHVDYLLLSYIIYKQGLSTPYIAAGNNLNMPIIGKILRGGGAFFMRRSFRDNPLYASVFKEYMHSMVQRNTPLEYFIEGGRSRSGRLLPAKLGMLSMTVQSHLRKAGKPIVFIPTYIGYERIMEGGTYIGELKGKPKESENLLALFKTGKKLERIFGTVHVNFGTPLFLNDFMEKFEVGPNSLPADTTEIELDKKTKAMISNLGIKILQNINKSAVINPISLLSLVILSTPNSALDEETCLEQIALYKKIVTDLPYDEDMSVTEMSPQEIIDYGIQLKLVERTPHLLGSLIQVANNQSALLSYFRNNILHVYISASFLAAMLHRNGDISRLSIETIFEQLYPFLQNELFLKFPQRTIVETINQKLDNLIDLGLIVDSGNGRVHMPKANSKSDQQLKVLATPIEQSLERYIMTLTLMAQQGSGKLTAKQVVDLCYLLGQRLSVLYADDIPDSFERALFTSFINALIRLDYVQKDKDSGLLYFDERINQIAENSRYILSLDVMHTLHQIANLEEKEIKRIIAELHEKKARKFMKKGK
ncbi:MAG: glycerol-3-phosphate 1-O-acyltransferase PlsB [Moraxellaceae bacterium]|nr:glycerol-3-phosphate 1-O-acyltransferase PlsB [Moraxellaceae bacterium]